jgi:hypothetical protein
MDGGPCGAGNVFDGVRAVADAVLYEGYLLYPYRRSAGKNRVRWQFGVLAPPSWVRVDGRDDDSVAGSVESWWQQTECLVEPEDGANLRVRLRFLQVQRRTVQRLVGAVHRPVDVLEAGGQTHLCFDEAVPREFDLDVPVAGLRGRPYRVGVEMPGGRDVESICDRGVAVGRLVRRRWPVSALVTVSGSACAPPSAMVRLRVRVENRDRSTPAQAPRERALRRSLISTHLLLAVDRGRFLSLLEPPASARDAAEACRNVHTFPVLAGDGDPDRVVLSSPIILYDHPRIAPESPGDLHDATEIDEILSLRTLTLTETERREARATDPRSAAIIDRVEAMTPEALARLHGTIRMPRRPDGPDPVGGPEPASGAPDSVIVAGTRVGKGSRLRLRPSGRGTDAQDMFLDGRTARVEDILLDVDGSRFLAVTVDDDPGAGMHHWYGRLRHFRPDEVEPLHGGEPPT